MRRGRLDGSPPEMGPRWFSDGSEDGVALRVFDKEAVLVNNGGAISIAQFIEADEVVSELWDDVAGAGLEGRDSWDGQLGHGCRGVGVASGSADGDGWCCWIDVKKWGGGGEVVITGAGVNDCGGV